MVKTFTRISDSKSVLLTIDDGPNPETTPLLLQILAQYNVKANFFVCGNKVALYPELAALIVKSGHSLFSHGYSHNNFSTLTFDEIVRELTDTEALLVRFRPTPRPYSIRPPLWPGS